MKMLLFVSVIILLLQSCNGSGGSSSSVAAASCPSFDFVNDMVEATYTGDVVTTSGNCDNGGSEYTITVDADLGTAGVHSITGWRMINSVLTTNSGNKNFTTGGRFQTTNGVAESHGLEFTPVNHTTCQNAKSINGTNDYLILNVTAEYDSGCRPRLRGTFREYSVCTDTTEVEICSGTVTLTR